MNHHFSHAELAALVPAQGQGYDWANLCELIPGLLQLEDTPQDPLYHAEGNVGIHTRLVLDALLADDVYQHADTDRRFVLFVAALLHDISKPLTTVIDTATGRVSQPGHSRKGAIDVRGMLWHAQTPFDVRERICRIVQSHQVPFFAFTSKTGQSPQRIARTLSWQLPLPDLVAVARADMRGRNYVGKDGCLQDIELFEIAAREDGCWDGPKAFADAHTRVMYARGNELHLDTPLYQPAGSNVTVMSGLPASGKDTWVAKNRLGVSVVSFDNAKADLGLKHGQNDGLAAHHAIDQAKALLREKAPFVFNATHLSQQMRDKTLDLLFSYDANVEVVYLEASPATVFSRNSKRDTSLRNADIVKMLHRWEVPVPAEAHAIQCIPNH